MAKKKPGGKRIRSFIERRNEMLKSKGQSDGTQTQSKLGKAAKAMLGAGMKKRKK